MVCKNCGNEMPDGSELCNACGTVAEEAVVLTEETAVKEAAQVSAPKKKTNWLMVILAAVAGLVLVAVLAGAILYGIGINPVELLKPRPNDVTRKDNYYVEDEKAREKSGQVIATVGSRELTNGELQIYYWEAVFNFIDQNYYYLTSYGLDLTKPLNEQTCALVEGQTWQQFFLDAAVSTWQRYTTLECLAEESGYQADEEIQQFLDELPTSIQENAASYGYDDVTAWLESNCGAGASEEGYLNYISAYYKGTFYLSDNEELIAVTDQEIEAYFAENEAALAEAGITKDMGKYHDVRHILIEVTGTGTDAEGNTVITDEDWEKCLAEAEKIRDEWLKDGGTEEGFAEYAAKYSADPGSSTSGGLYEDLTASTSFIQPFKDWYLEENRKPGDTGFVKNTQSSVQGYHIMYYSASEDMWIEAVSQNVMSQKITDLIEEGMERYPMEITYKKIALGDQELQ